MGLCSEQRKVLLYCSFVMFEQCKCIQWGVVWLHRMDVCDRVRICVSHTSQVHARAGPGLRSTSPASNRRRVFSFPEASPPVPEFPLRDPTKPAGKNWWWSAEKTTVGSPFRGTGLSETFCVFFLFFRSLRKTAPRPRAGRLVVGVL